MWVQDTLNSIDKQVDEDGFNGTLHISCEDYGVIKKALELQIPKKPEQGTINAFIYACPTCGGPVGSLEVEEIWCDFCPKCGQAIDKSLDWSD